MTDTFHLQRILAVCETDASDKTKVRRIYRLAAQAIAIADTHPKDGDVEQAPSLMSGGGDEGNRPKDNQ